MSEQNIILNRETKKHQILNINWARKIVRDGNNNFLDNDQIANILRKELYLRGITEEDFHIAVMKKNHLVKNFFLLGFLYITGIGTPDENSEAIKWYKKAAESGDYMAHNELGIFYKSFFTIQNQSFDHFMKATYGGNICGEANLAVCFLNGDGTSTNFDLAIHHLMNAAKAGHPYSQRLLGDFYSDCTGVNPRKAFYWYQKSCHHAIRFEGGDSSSLIHIAHCYEIGFGTESDWHAVLSFYNKAMKKGNISVKFLLDYLFDKNS
ncbi:hypothetical protein G9A89_016921 [Geosiphon pyriformis]|nr:hypothetical protein G9A89_016921 [Geosiphon pyriformis]